MKQYIGKTCKLHIVVNGKDLFYTAKVKDVSDTHISFIDKFGEDYTFRMTDIVEIRG